MYERERGFTLIELMAVVAIVAILAMVAVPMFTREARKTKTLSEVSPMFTEISIRLEQYKTEKNFYLGVAGDAVGTTTCPATPNSAGYNFVTTCKVTDVNANSKLDKGDTIVCSEPSQNTLGKDLAGKEIDVELFATVDGAEERVGDASYDAK